MSPEPSRQRVRWLSAMVLVGTFVAGLLTGLGLAPSHAPPHPPPGGPGAVPGLKPAFPFKEVGLNAEQEAQVKQILARSKPRMDQLMAQLLPPIQALSAEIEQEVLRVLTPEQRERLEQFKRANPPPRPPPTGPSSPPDGPH